jgi:glycosyltransferase involved in cell wall biosynthesis
MKTLYNKNIKIISPWSEKCLEDVKGLKFDLIHANPFTGILRGYEIAKQFKKPLFVTIHGLYNYGLDQIEIANYTSKVIAVDHGIEKALIKSNTCVNKIEVLYNPIDLKDFYPAKPFPKLLSELQLNKSYKTIAVVTRYDDNKEIPAQQFARIIPQLADRLGGLNVVFVGDGTKLDLIKNTLKDSENANVRFVGSQMNVRNYMNLADLVLASARTAAESICCGKLTFQMGIGKWGALIDKDNYKDTIFDMTYYTDYSDGELVSHLSWFLNQKNEMDRVTNGLSDIVRQQVDLNNTITRLEQIYQGG